jgi:hypothetical protein
MGSQLTVLMRSAYDGADYPLILNRVKPVLDSSRLQQPSSTSSRGSRDSLKSQAPRGCGVGATFEYRGGLHYVASVSVGGPAYHSEKLHCGDCVLQVNGQSVSILTDEELDDLITVSLPPGAAFVNALPCTYFIPLRRECDFRRPGVRFYTCAIIDRKKRKENHQAQAQVHIICSTKPIVLMLGVAFVSDRVLRDRTSLCLSAHQPRISTRLG